jgi:hypothetical protein
MISTGILHLKWDPNHCEGLSSLSFDFIKGMGRRRRAENLRGFRLVSEPKPSALKTKKYQIEAKN